MQAFDLRNLPPSNHAVHLIPQSELIETRLGTDRLAGSTPEGRAASERQGRARFEAQVAPEVHRIDTAPTVDPVEAINRQLFDDAVSLDTDDTLGHEGTITADPSN